MTDVFPFVSALVAVKGRAILRSPFLAALGTLGRFTLGIEDVVVLAREAGLTRHLCGTSLPALSSRIDVALDGSVPQWTMLCPLR